MFVATTRTLPHPQAHPKQGSTFRCRRSSHAPRYLSQNDAPAFFGTDTPTARLFSFAWRSCIEATFLETATPIARLFICWPELICWPPLDEKASAIISPC